MQVHFAHDWAVPVRVAHNLFRSIASGHTKTVIKIAGSTGHARAEKTIAMNLLRFDLSVRLPIQHDVDLFHVGPENADGQIVADAVWSQYPEWIGMCRREKCVQLVRRQPDNFKRSHVR